MSLSEQLTAVFKAGLASDPELRQSLAEALDSSSLSDSKATKLEANYRVPENPETEGCCGDCSHYSDGDSDGVGSCELVVGIIDPELVCDWYEGSGVDGQANSE